VNDDEFVYYIKNNNLFIKYKFKPVETQNVGNISSSTISSSSTHAKVIRKREFTSSDEKLINFEKIIDKFINNEENDDNFKNYTSFGYFLSIIIIIIIIKKQIILIIKKQCSNNNNNRQIEVVISNPV
jgi:hypothetical protein